MLPQESVAGFMSKRKDMPATESVLLQRRAEARAALRKCPDSETAHVLRRALRRIKSALFSLRHRADPGRKEHAYRMRRHAKLRTHLERLAPLPDDQLVNQTRTAGYMKRLLAAKLLRYAPGAK